MSRAREFSINAYPLGAVAESGPSAGYGGQTGGVGGSHDFSIYKDTGCEASPRCTACPLVMCRYDFEYSGLYLAVQATIKAGIPLPAHLLELRRPVRVPVSDVATVEQRKAVRDANHAWLKEAMKA